MFSGGLENCVTRIGPLPLRPCVCVCVCVYGKAVPLLDKPTSLGHCGTGENEAYFYLLDMSWFACISCFPVQNGHWAIFHLCLSSLINNIIVLFVCLNVHLCVWVWNCPTSNLSFFFHYMPSIYFGFISFSRALWEAILFVLAQAVSLSDLSHWHTRNM